MIRLLLLAAAAHVAWPAAAQDHSAHGSHGAAHGAAPVGAPAPAPAADPLDSDAIAPEPHGSMDHAQTDHAQSGHEAHAKPADAEHRGHFPGGQNHAAHPVSPAASSPPPRALKGPGHAADAIYGAAAMAPSRQDLAEMDAMAVGTAMFERLEARVGGGEDLYLWDAQGWYGGDFDKLWLKSEGEGAFSGAIESAEVQALWSHAIDPWFDLQAGVRYDIEPRGRAHLVLGLQGLAPYMFEVDAAAFLSSKGDVTARLEGEYDQRLTQRLILQPRAEIELAAQDIPEIGIGAGVSSIEGGLRLRYEIVREIAPYVGFGYETSLGETADYARAAGDDPDGVTFIVGLRAWF